MSSKVLNIIICTNVSIKTGLFPSSITHACFCAVVVDYRNDPKSSTGNFELIYRQVIPPAPAYFGLDLALKGAQLCLKNVNGKKYEQRSDASKIKIEQRAFQLQPQSQKMFPSLMKSPRDPSLNVPFRTSSSKKSLLRARFKAGSISQRSAKSRVPKQITIVHIPG